MEVRNHFSSYFSMSRADTINQLESPLLSVLDGSRIFNGSVNGNVLRIFYHSIIHSPFRNWLDRHDGDINLDFVLGGAKFGGDLCRSHHEWRGSVRFIIIFYVYAMLRQLLIIECRMSGIDVRFLFASISRAIRCRKSWDGSQTPTTTTFGVGWEKKGIHNISSEALPPSIYYRNYIFCRHTQSWRSSSSKPTSVDRSSHADSSTSIGDWRSRWVHNQCK